MEVVNVENKQENREKLINTKVLVIDRSGNIYANGIINGPLRHRDYLLEIADFLYPDNKIAEHIDEGIVSQDKISPFNVAYFFNMMGFVVILNSPSMEKVLNMPKYLCIFEGSKPNSLQIESIKYCLSYFTGYCTDFAANISAKLTPNLGKSWNTITFDGHPILNPLEAYVEYLEKEEMESKGLKLSLQKNQN